MCKVYKSEPMLYVFGTNQCSSIALMGTVLFTNRSNARYYTILIKLRQQFVSKIFMQYSSLFEQVSGKVSILQSHSYLIPTCIPSLNFEFGCPKFVEVGEIVFVNLFCTNHECC